MGTKTKICVFLLLSAAVFASAELRVRDPELGVCMHQCEKLREADQGEKLRCKQQCQRYQQEKGEREKGHQSRGSGGDHDEEFSIISNEGRDPREMLAECHQQCQGSQERPECFRTCIKKFQGERHQRPHAEAEQKKRPGGGRGQAEEGSQGRRRESNNPFVFEDHHFTTKLETEQGGVRVLQKFTDRSEIFRGIEDYRVAILEAEPQTFVVPSHWDADALVFVAKGKATVSLINQESRESFNIKRGDLFRVPAGFGVYLINRDNNEKLVLAKILRSISVPGELQTFFGSGGENPESSFFDAFSPELLEAAFKSERDDIEKLFTPDRREQGLFKRASEEQIRALSGGDGGRVWPFKQKAGSFNVFRKEPTVRNEFGRLYEVDSNRFPDLHEFNVAFSYFNITQGSIAGPFYNAKATVAAVVANGEGRFEMACPHLSEQTGSPRKGSRGPSYEGVSSNLRQGTVVVFPAGHPVAFEALGDRSLEIICFGLNSDQNEWFLLAGDGNVMSQWQDEAMELTFGVAAKEAQKVINNQKERLFFEGPQRRAVA